MTAPAVEVAALVVMTIPGKPMPKERPRHGANGNVYTPRDTAEYAATIGWVARAAMRGRKPSLARLAVVIDLYGPGVASGDVDNYAKAILDGSNRILWRDDKQVDDLHVRRHIDDSTERAVVVVTEIPAPTQREAN